MENKKFKLCVLTGYDAVALFDDEGIEPFLDEDTKPEDTMVNEYSFSTQEDLNEAVQMLGDALDTSAYSIITEEEHNKIEKTFSL